MTDKEKEAETIKWLGGYIKAVEEASTGCEQKLILPDLQNVKNLIKQLQVEIIGLIGVIVEATRSPDRKQRNIELLEQRKKDFDLGTGEKNER